MYIDIDNICLFRYTFIYIYIYICIYLYIDVDIDILTSRMTRMNSCTMIVGVLWHHWCFFVQLQVGEHEKLGIINLMQFSPLPGPWRPPCRWIASSSRRFGHCEISPKPGGNPQWREKNTHRFIFYLLKTHQVGWVPFIGWVPTIYAFL